MQHIELTENEVYTLAVVLSTVNNNLIYDKQAKVYTENSDDFILEINKNDKAAITRVLNKL